MYVSLRWHSEKLPLLAKCTTFSDRHAGRLQSCLISAGPLHTIKGKIISTPGMFNFPEWFIRFFLCYARERPHPGGDRLSTWLLLTAFIYFPLTSAVVFPGFGIQRVVVKDWTWWQHAGDSFWWSRPLQNQDVLFVNGSDWLGTVMMGFTSRPVTAFICGQQWPTITLHCLADKLWIFWSHFVTSWVLGSYNSKTHLSNNFSRETGNWMSF